MRELRVEDALIYLDQVKVEFGDRPHIYNEFLDIMKTFKTQQIDTPGVIRRVSNLFQGNRRLVLGFNTFLPEGYRIEIPTDGSGPPVAVYRAPGSNIAHILRESAESQAVSIAQQQPLPPGNNNSNNGMNNAAQYHPGGMPASMPGRLPLSPPPGTADLHGASSNLPFGPGSAAAAAMNNRPQQPQQSSANPAGQMLSSINDSGGVALRQQQQSMQIDSSTSNSQQQQNISNLPMSQLPAGIAPRKPNIMMMGNNGPNNNNNLMQQMQQQQAAMHQQQSAMAMSQQQQSNNMMMQQQQQQMGGNNNTMLSGNSMMPQAPAPFGGTMNNNSNNVVMNHPSGVPAGGVPAAPGTTPTATAVGGAGQPLEFDHAINYVTTIKRRFASEPETYKKFLEILHTYQKEQRGIKEVLDEVSELFEDHPDLLKEFTFFLPDAVQSTAKLQLDQVAKESEARKRSKAKAAIMNAAQAMQRPASLTGKNDERVAPPSGGPFPHTTPSSGQARTTSSLEREAFISRGARYGTVLFDPVRPPFKNELTPAMAALKHGRPTHIPECGKLPNTTEEAFFQHVKDHLNRRELASDKPAGTRRHTPHAEFLKCLHLFGAGVLNKEELGLLLKGLFLQGHAPKSGVHAGGAGQNPLIANAANELMNEFDKVLLGRGPYADQQNALKDKSKYGAQRIRDFDWNHSSTTQVSPSYFTYPSDYPYELFLSHPGQSQADRSVLNSELVCVAGVTTTKTENTNGSARAKINRNTKQHSKRKICPSIEESDGSKHRSNAYEKMMFRIEDERYELDMAIERNTHALRRIEPFAKEAQGVREQEEKDGQPIGRLRYQLHRSSLNTIHINAIGRIYGDRGDEILHHLLRNPLIVLPVVYQRLKQKDVEWRNAKKLLADRWDAIVEANYEGSMDAQCYFNRKALEKSFALSRLLDQCKRAQLYWKNPEKFNDHSATRPFAPTYGRRVADARALLFQPYVEVKCKVDIGHKHALEFIVMRIKHSDISPFDRERIGRIFAEFLLPWFQYPVHWILQEIRDSFRGKLNPSVTKYVSGQRVQTIFGAGTIASFIDAGGNTNPKYRVKLPFGLGHLSPSAILYAIPSKDAPYVRRDGIMVRDETSYYGCSDSSPKLDPKYQLLFGTQVTYHFFRLYLLLCSLLSNIHEHVKKNPPLDNPADLWVQSINNHDGSTPKNKSPKLTYTSMQVALRKVIKREMSGRDFESMARNISKDIVHQMAVLPALIDRCVERLVKLAEEDTLLQLYDYCHTSDGKMIDPVMVKSQCVAIAPDAYYRIQTDVAMDRVRFNYLESHEPLLVYPDVTMDDPDGGGDDHLMMMMETGDEGVGGGATTDDMELPEAGDEPHDRARPESKRARFA